METGAKCQNHLPSCPLKQFEVMDDNWSRLDLADIRSTFTYLSVLYAH